MNLIAPTVVLASIVASDPALFEEIALSATDPSGLDELRSDIEYLLSEQDQDFAGFLEANGLALTDEGISFDPEKLDAIDAVANTIIQEYEIPEGKRPTWERFGLESDEDCDYSGHYVLRITKLLRIFVQRFGNL